MGLLLYSQRERVAPLSSAVDCVNTATLETALKWFWQEACEPHESKSGPWVKEWHKRLRSWDELRSHLIVQNQLRLLTGDILSHGYIVCMCALKWGFHKQKWEGDRLYCHWFMFLMMVLPFHTIRIPANNLHVQEIKENLNFYKYI